tara:strand:+ start:6106 stop:6312 length:207 start_codon:yes stop_codon:yes gene_type:complete
VVAVGFEPTKPKRLIYSQVVLTAHPYYHFYLVIVAGLEPAIAEAGGFTIRWFNQFTHTTIYYTYKKSS